MVPFLEKKVAQIVVTETSEDYKPATCADVLSKYHGP